MSDESNIICSDTRKATDRRNERNLRSKIHPSRVDKTFLDEHVLVLSSLWPTMPCRPLSTSWGDKVVEQSPNDPEARALDRSKGTRESINPSWVKIAEGRLRALHRQTLLDEATADRTIRSDRKTV